MLKMEYLLEELIQLVKVARSEKEDILGYLLEMAIAEVKDRIALRRAAKSEDRTF